ncbi:MAG: RecB family exonuclease [Actinomycetes bacterium]
MALPLPTSLSPSRVASFKSCPLAFRLSTIERLPEAPSEPAVKGTTVHRALELLFTEPPERRTRDRATETLTAALEEMSTDTDYVGLGLDGPAADRFARDCTAMVERYFHLEDPAEVHPIGLELKLQTELDTLTVRGVIDRLELDADGELVVTDYKTGRAPRKEQEQERMAGVHIYSMMVEKVFGRRPAKVQLIYLGRDPQIIGSPTSERTVAGVEKKVGAVWAAVERACATEDFRARTSALCNYCSFHEFCPEQGGDLARAAEVAVALRQV